MSNRLTNDMRGKIVNAVLHHKFDGLIAALCRDYAKLADRVYADGFKSVRAKIDGLPEGWLPVDASIKIELGAMVPSLYFNGRFLSGRYDYVKDANNSRISTEEFHSFAEWPEHEHRRFPNKKKGTCVSQYDATHEFPTTYDALTNRKVDLIISWLQTRDTLIATVGRFTTIDKLLEAWPEIEPFTKGVAAKPKPQLPAVPVMKLNEMLGLPVDDEVSA